MRDTYRTRSQRRDSRDSYYPARHSGYRRDYSRSETDANFIICAVILAALVIVACFIVV